MGPRRFAISVVGVGHWDMLVLMVMGLPEVEPCVYSGLEYYNQIKSVAANSLDFAKNVLAQKKCNRALGCRRGRPSEISAH